MRCPSYCLLNWWCRLTRYRYATDNRPPTQSEALLDKLLTVLAGSLNRPFALDAFCEQQGCSEHACASSFVRPG
ncbi:hypothetical protein ACNKHO_25005 [Shigella flexneri]